MHIPSLPTADSQRMYARSFGGYDLREGGDSLTFTHTENMSSDSYPLACTRKPRGLINTQNYEIFNIISMDIIKNQGSGEIVKGALVADCRGMLRAFYEDNGTYSPHNLLITSSFAEQEHKILTPCGASLYIFPDGKKVNFASSATTEALECSQSLALGASDGYFYEFKFTPCDIDGNPVSENAMFTAIQRPYYSLSGSGKGEYKGLMSFNSVFSDGDCVRISGLSLPDANGSYFYIQKHDRVGRKLIVKGSFSLTQSSGTVYIARRIPKMDFVIAAKNRLWGCRYGYNTDGEPVNEIYACAHGDAKNWYRFQGISSDSWAASVGTPGAFTGAVCYNGFPVFFKEDCIIIIFGDTPADFTLSETGARGVEAGCDKSIVSINDTLYYKSYSGIVKYDGGLPKSVDAPLGGTRYKNAVGGGCGEKYYVSMEDQKGKHHLFVYDTEKNIWHREDSLKAKAFCRCNSILYMLCDDSRIYSVDNTVSAYIPGASDEEVPFNWELVTKSFGYETAEHKYISAISLRGESEENAVIEVFIQYDGSGVWHRISPRISRKDGTVNARIVPVRCDSFKIKLCGRGKFKLKTLETVTEKGDEL